MSDDTRDQILHRYIGSNRFVPADDTAEMRQIRVLVAWVARNFGGVAVVRIGEEEGGESRDSHSRAD